MSPVQPPVLVALHSVHAPELEHTGEAGGQSASLVQPTQVSMVVSHTGVLPVHCVWLVVEHCAHDPSARHTGRACGQSASVWQPRQEPVV